jgi:hypothetical protein
LFEELPIKLSAAEPPVAFSMEIRLSVPSPVATALERSMARELFAVE